MWRLNENNLYVYDEITNDDKLPSHETYFHKAVNQPVPSSSRAGSRSLWLLQHCWHFPYEANLKPGQQPWRHHHSPPQRLPQQCRVLSLKIMLKNSLCTLSTNFTAWPDVCRFCVVTHICLCIGPRTCLMSSQPSYQCRVFITIRWCISHCVMRSTVQRQRSSGGRWEAGS